MVIIYYGGQVRQDGGRLGSNWARWQMGRSSWVSLDWGDCCDRSRRYHELVTDDNDGDKNATREYIAGGIGQGGQSRVLGLSWAQHRLRVLIRLSHVKNCPFFLYEVEFLLLYLNCVEEKK